MRNFGRLIMGHIWQIVVQTTHAPLSAAEVTVYKLVTQGQLLS